MRASNRDLNSSMLASNECVLAKVQFGQRKWTDRYWGIAFVLFALLHICVGIVLMVSTSSYMVKLPASCVNMNCFYEQGNCSFGLASLRMLDSQREQPCENPCTSEEYVFDYAWDMCIKKEDGDVLELVKCDAQSDAKQRDENKVLPLTRLLADTKWIMWTMLLATLGVGVILGIVFKFLPIFTMILAMSFNVLAVAGLAIWAGWHHSYYCIVFALATILYCGYLWFFQQRYKIAAKLMREVSTFFKKHLKIHGFEFLAACIWGAHFTFSAIVTLQTLRIRHFRELQNMEFCGSEIKYWAKCCYTIFVLGFFWTTLWIQQVRWSTVCGTLSSWYFHEQTIDMPRFPIAKAFTWSITTSLGPNALGSITTPLMDKVNVIGHSWFTIYTNPCGWARACMSTCCQRISLVLTRNATVVHMITGTSLFHSGEIAFGSLQRQFNVHDVFSMHCEGVVNLSCHLLAAYVSLCSYWCIIDYYSLSFFDTTEATPINSILIVFAIASILPTSTITLLIYAAMTTTQSQQFDDRSNIKFLCMLIGAISFYIFKHCLTIVPNASSALFVCYAIEKDNDVHQPRLAKFYNLMHQVSSDDKNTEFDIIASV